MSSVKPLQHNGVTTEVLACSADRTFGWLHPAHLHQPGSKIEYFTCPGSLQCEVCTKVVWRDEMVAHIQSEHLDRKQSSADAMAATWSDANPPARIMCPESAVKPNEHQCSFVSNADSAVVRRHLWLSHGWSVKQTDEYMADPWLSDEPRAAWKDRIFARKYGLGSSDALTVAPAPEVEVTEAPSLESVLTEWWLARAKEEASAVVPKAVSYGSNSLMQLGRKMAQLQGRTVEDDEALELGCWANLVQKVERMTDAVMRGERCSDDTIYDVGVYIKMVQRVRDAGSWPGV